MVSSVVLASWEFISAVKISASPGWHLIRKPDARGSSVDPDLLTHAFSPVQSSDSWFPLLVRHAHEFCEEAPTHCPLS